MIGKISRRDLFRQVSMATAAIGLAELGGLRQARAEDSFTIASTGGSSGEAVREAFVVVPKLEDRFKQTVSHAFQIDQVAASKMLAQPDNPPFSVSNQAQSEAILLADNNRLRAYDLDIVKNYKDILPAVTLAPQNGMEAWYSSYSLMLFGLVYNTKYVDGTPTSFNELANEKYRGRIGIPAFGWFGMMWLHQINRALGGKENDVSRGIAAVSDLVKKNKAVLLENSDQTMKAFEREEIVIAPYFNGRTTRMQDGGAPVKIAYVPGTTTVGSGFVVAKGTRFPEMAQAFINNSLDPEFQLLVSKQVGFPPSNRKAVIPTGLQRNLPTDKELENIIQLDWNTVSKGLASNLERWNKEVL